MEALDCETNPFHRAPIGTATCCRPSVSAEPACVRRRPDAARRERGPRTPTAPATPSPWTVGEGADARVPSVRGTALSATFTATGTITPIVLASCPTGTSGDPINDPSLQYGLFLTNTEGRARKVTELDLHFSSNGRANSLSTVTIELELRSNGWAGAPVAFGAGQQLMAKLEVLSNPDGSTINFNTGPCAPGSNCVPPPSCTATEVRSPKGLTPAWSFWRKSVVMTLRGH